MAVLRMDHIGVVVRDIDAATAFFERLGMTATDSGEVEGEWVGRIIGLKDVHTKIQWLTTADGAGRIELIEYLSPEAVPGAAEGPSNALGIRHFTLMVDDLEATVAEMLEHGAELVGTIENYEDIYLLCYMRGPEGIIVEVTEKLS